MDPIKPPVTATATCATCKWTITASGQDAVAVGKVVRQLLLEHQVGHADARKEQS